MSNNHRGKIHFWQRWYVVKYISNNNGGSIPFQQQWSNMLPATMVCNQMYFPQKWSQIHVQQQWSNTFPTTMVCGQRYFQQQWYVVKHISNNNGQIHVQQQRHVVKCFPTTIVCRQISELNPVVKLHDLKLPCTVNFVCANKFKFDSHVCIHNVLMFLCWLSGKPGLDNDQKCVYPKRAYRCIRDCLN